MLNLSPDFLSRMKCILGDEYPMFLQSLEQPKENAIYVNQNKMAVGKFKELIDFKISPIEYEPAGFYVDSTKKGRHPLHHAGVFYMQEPSAMFTVNAHQFKGDELVLDLCAAPGGKSIQIANRIPNGTLVSNEINKTRSEILFSNIERMGLKNVIVTNDKPENIAKAYADTFDVCLVDAPCSGEGMFRRGETVVQEWNKNLPAMCAERQLNILHHADIALKQNGILIYSTCTYSLEENEQVVTTFMKNYGYEIVNIKQNISRGINLEQAVRLYPHRVKGEGQFVAVLKKKSENLHCAENPMRLCVDKTAQKWLEANTNLTCAVYESGNFSYIVSNAQLIKRKINYISWGVRAFERHDKRVEPHHNLFTAFGLEFNNKIDLEFTHLNVEKYLKGETFSCENENGYAAVLINSAAVGGVKITNGVAKNHYPKGLRNFK